MAYNKKADANYRKKYKYIGLKYAISELDEYKRISNYCATNKLSLQGYIKALIKADLDVKGIEYGSVTDDTEQDT